MLLYYITDRTQFSGDEASRRRRLLDKVAEAAAAGVDYIQLREKDLPARDLEILAGQALDRIRGKNSHTALLINSRTDLAIAVGAQGVHLRSDDVPPEDIREVYEKYGVAALAGGASPIIGVSCHTVHQIAQAAASRATFAVFGPIFGKNDTQPVGLAALREARHHKIPVLALGGIDLGNANSCLHAGAAGIAAIRLFQECNISDIVRRLR